MQARETWLETDRLTDAFTDSKLTGDDFSLAFGFLNSLVVAM